MAAWIPAGHTACMVASSEQLGGPGMKTSIFKKAASTFSVIEIKPCLCLGQAVHGATASRMSMIMRQLPHLADSFKKHDSFLQWHQAMIAAHGKVVNGAELSTRVEL